MEILNTALVGCGGMAAHYRHIYNEIDGVRLAMVIDSDLSVAKEAAQALDVAKYSDNFSDCLADHIHIVDISTPNFLHVEQAEAALNAGKHVLIQKPVAVNVEETERILRAVRKSGKTAGVYMSLRSMPIYNEIKDIIGSGLLGRVTSTFFKRSNGGGLSMKPGTWRGDAQKTGGGAFIQLGVHALDLCTWLRDEKIKTVSAMSKHLMCDNIGGDDVSVVVFEYEDGALGTIEASYCSGINMTEIYGSRGYICYNETLGDLVLRLDGEYSGEIVKYPERRKIMRFNHSRIESLYSASNQYEQHAVFLNAIKNNKKAPVTVSDALRVMRIVEAVYQSSRLQKSIGLETVD